MIDPQLIRQNLTEISERLARRCFSLPQNQLIELEQTRKQYQVETQHLQSERNRLAKTIGQMKAKGENVNDLLNESTAINEKLAAIETRLISVQDTLSEILFSVPNVPHDSVPIGKTEADNLEIRRWGTPREFAFTPQDHTDIGTKLGLLDFETATKITGTRFVILRGALARLQRALIQFMLDIHIQEHGYTEVYVPFLVNSDSLLGTGQLPKFAADLFHITEQNYYLIPTAEVPVTNMARETILDDLPLKMVCHTPCFRSEAGNYGKDTRGMIRQHQFEKVELVQFVKPEDSYTALEELTHHAETILQRLDLPYRVVALCTGDLGFSSAKTYDLEVWLPGQQKYREISSCSNFEAFQARRMKARWRDPNSKKPVLIHTLNGSGLAVGRTLVAIMENYQDWAGRIVIPEVLQKYMGEMVHIS